MKRAIKTAITLCICISVLFALTSCSFGFIGNLFGGMFSGGGSTNQNIAKFKISEGEIFAYDDDGERINYNNEFVSRGNNTYYVINNFIVYNLFIIDGYVYDFGDDGIMLKNQTHNGYVFDDDGRLVGNNIFVIVNNVT